MIQQRKDNRWHVVVDYTRKSDGTINKDGVSLGDFETQEEALTAHRALVREYNTLKRMGTNEQKNTV